MDRRQFLSTGSAALCLPLLTHGSPAAAFVFQPSTAPAGDARLNALFERIFQEQVRTSPTTATFLGLDKGELAERG